MSRGLGTYHFNQGVGGGAGGASGERYLSRSLKNIQEKWSSILYFNQWVVSICVETLKPLTILTTATITRLQNLKITNRII